ncbi:MAG: cell filamentation protein Fic [Deltaproteobacteria bacterium CG11_big_fil_rev_8_21_14_0_20_49_13]|nr:MAG: cell filamentation protein Fic [Deltaproteobacteria bacterium CG11_big_fil_rev_8_21_14_0_20_49_13]
MELTFGIFFGIFFGVKRLLQTPLNPQVLSYVKNIGKFLKQWELSKDLQKDFYSWLKATTIITSAGASTRIEGARISDEEILERLENLKIQKIKDRDEAEVAGYIDCLNYVFENYNNINISEHTARSLHQMMCSYLTNDILPPNQRGSYKNVPNSVVKTDHKTGEEDVIFETTPPGIETDIAMKELFEDYNNFINDTDYSDLEVIAAFVVKFLAIHPFRDGNGRISRILTNLCLLKQGYEFTMYSSHEKTVEDNKELYYISIRQTQGSMKGTPDINPWFLFFLKMLNVQAEILKEKMVSKGSGRLTDFEDTILVLIQKYQPVTISFLERTSDIKRVTIKSILKKLKSLGMIEMTGSTKGSFYKLKR